MICGIDEAGRGPVLGPLVIAGVKIQDEKELVNLNVRDSKKLTPERRDKLASEIRNIAEIETIMLSASELDVLRQAMSLNEIEALLFTKLIKSLKPEKVFVDCVDTNEENFKKRLLERLSEKPHITSKHKADDIFPVVSAASIIAKTERDREMIRIAEELGSDIGSGYPADPITIEFIREWLKNKGNFPPYTRHSWKTARRIFEDVKYRSITLDDY